MKTVKTAYMIVKHICVIVKTTDVDCKHLIFGPGHPIVFVRWSEASEKGLEHLTWSLVSHSSCPDVSFM